MICKKENMQFYNYVNIKRKRKLFKKKIFFYLVTYKNIFFFKNKKHIEHNKYDNYFENYKFIN